MIDSNKPVYGKSNPIIDNDQGFRRIASVIGLKADKEQYYRELHANAWDTVLKRLHVSNIRNYSIYIAELAGMKYLFSYFEYVGESFEEDMQAIVDDPETQRWWKETGPCQISSVADQSEATWRELEQVFFNP